MSPFRAVRAAVAAAVLFAAAGAGAAGGSAALMQAYVRFAFVRGLSPQAERLAAGLDAPAAQEVREQIAAWRAARKGEIRGALVDAFAADAEARFGAFVDQYAAGRRGGDAALLASLAGAAGLDPAPADYDRLEVALGEAWLAGDVAAAGVLLGEIEGWIGARPKMDPPIPLAAWLARAEPAAPPAPPPSRGAQLAGAEAEAPPVDDEALQGAASSLDGFSRLRQDRRQRAFADAEKAMTQVAAERTAVEQEAAARKLAAAQADAEAVKKQAARLAAADAEALEQRKNSWGNKLKGLAGSLISATTGAFTGTIGAEAGRRAAGELFQ